MIKLIFTSALLVGSLFFFQQSLVSTTANEKAVVMEPPTPQAQPVEQIESIETTQKCDYVEIRVKVGDQVKVIRQYYSCRT